MLHALLAPLPITHLIQRIQNILPHRRILRRRLEREHQRSLHNRQPQRLSAPTVLDEHPDAVALIHDFGLQLCRPLKGFFAGYY